MSAESEFTRDKDGFLKCQDCPRRFLTETGFENHSTNQHEKEIKPDQNQQYGPSFPKNTQSKEECSPDNLLFRSQVDLKLHRSVEHQITANHCNECKKLFRYTCFVLDIRLENEPRVETPLRQNLIHR